MAGAAAPDMDEICSAADGPVLVLGSLPPAGRDHDLMVEAGGRERLAGALARHGFERFGATWVRFGPGRLDLVDLVTPSEWGLAGPEAAELWSAAAPLEPGSSMWQPAPHHRLLILARKAPARPGADLPDRHRDRVEQALAEDPGAWARAGDRAEGWGMGDGLIRLRRAYERSAAGPSRAAPAPRWSWVPRPRRPRRGALIALSGLDGSGKTTQAAALQATLEQLGREVEVVWSPMGRTRGLDALERLASRLRLSAAPAGGGPPGAHDGATGGATSPGVMSPARRVARTAWWCAIGAGTAMSYRRSARGTRLGGRVVIHDRYVLDGLVDLRFAGRPPAPIPLAEAVFRVLTPRPRWAFLLSARPETVHARKPDWSLAQTRVRAALYAELQPDLEVRVLDAEQPAGRLTAQIARPVFAGLVGAPSGGSSPSSSSRDGF